MNVRFLLIIVMLMEHVIIRMGHLLAHVIVAILEMESHVKVRELLTFFEASFKKCHKTSGLLYANAFKMN